MFRILSGNDSDQRLILKRFLIAMGSYALWMGLGLLSARTTASTTDDLTVQLAIVGALVTNAIFYAILRSGVSKGLRDPSLALYQILVAMSWLLVLLYCVNEKRGLLLVGNVMIMMFGVFSLRRVELIVAAAYAFFGYVAIVVVDIMVYPGRLVMLDEVLRLTVLGGMMGWCILFSNHVGQLRRKLARRNVDLKQAVDEISTLASRDDLTQAFNRRYIMAALNQEKARVDRSGGTFSVTILDLDHFKSINDRYGHLAGDRVLLAFADRTRSALRGMDTIDSLERGGSLGRYGGEEFIMLLPDTDLAGALRCAERVRRLTGEAPFDEVFDITVSAGVAEHRRGESIESTLRRADAALYEAKARGRDKVVAEDMDSDKIYELAVNEDKPTNVIVGPFGRKKPRGA